MFSLKAVIHQAAAVPFSSLISKEVYETLERVTRDIDSVLFVDAIASPIVVSYPQHQEEIVALFLRSSRWVLTPISPGIGYTTIDFSEPLVPARITGLEVQYGRMDLVTVNLVTNLTRMMRDFIWKPSKPGVPRYFYIDAIEWHIEVFRIGFPRNSFILETFIGNGVDRRLVRVI